MRRPCPTGGLSRQIKIVFIFKKNYINKLKPSVYVPPRVIFKKYIFNALKPSGYVPLSFIFKEVYVQRVKACWLLLVPVGFILKISAFCPFTELTCFFVNLRNNNE